MVVDVTIIDLSVDFLTYLPLNVSLRRDYILLITAVFEYLYIFMKYYLYTDGSANNFSPYGEGGYAYILTNSDKQIISQFSKGELHATNNTMELKAIIEGCKAIKEDGSIVIVVSDSQYALNALSGKYKLKANVDLIKEHYGDRKRLDIKYHWVKGHSGDELNELANQLAQDETLRIREQYGIPVYDYTNSPKVKNK